MASLSALAPSRAHGAELGCGVVAVEADAPFRERWPELLGRVRADLAARSELDTCARVDLRVEQGSAIGVLVTLPDGRTASRTAPRPEDVMPTLQALLLVPSRAPAPLTTSPAVLAPAAEPPSVTADRGNGAASSGLAGSPRALGIELSIMTSARIGDGQVGYGVGALSFVEASGWLVGFEGRADGYQPLLGGDTQTTLELALLAGRRFHFKPVALDLVTGPALAMSGVTFGQSETVAVREENGTTPPPESQRAPPSEASTGASSRWRFGMRLGFRPRSVFRPFVGIDGEVGLTRAADSDRSLSSPSAPLPSYTVGIGVGATVGTP
ncbi:MAG TPA: hypothetical protein VFV94_14035 [Polyangiaceae bacterium]|nr:hypothetical protein [Polyangiaceae bacterium]